MNPTAPKPENKEPYPARLQAFVLFCQGYSHGLISELLGVHQTMLSGWKKRDEWERWRDELLGTTNPVPVPTWVAHLLQQQYGLRQQVEDLKAELTAHAPHP